MRRLHATVGGVNELIGSASLPPAPTPLSLFFLLQRTSRPDGAAESKCQMRSCLSRHCGPAALWTTWIGSS